MGGTTILAAAVASVCLTLAAIHLGIWWRDRSAPAHLQFSLLAIAVAAFAWGNLAMMRAPTPQAFATAIIWSNVAIFAAVAGVVAFVRSYFRTGRPWLGHLAWGLRLVTLVVNFTRPTGMDYDAISSMSPVVFLGDTVFVPQGVTSVWHWIGQISFLLLLWLIIDASYTLWRDGSSSERRRALIVGIPTAVFVVMGGGYAALIFGGLLRWPHVECVFFLGVIGAMSHELGADVLRSAQLARDLQASDLALQESEQRMTMAADAARLGMWILDLRTGKTWLTDKCRELFALPATGAIEYASVLSRLHPDDRELTEAAVRRSIVTGDPYRTEYRVLRPDAGLRWISSQGSVELDETGRATRMLGICIDVSEQRNAEVEARELSGRLINAQEDERRRIARDLHDDLNQRLALLSVEVDLLGRGRPETFDAQTGSIALHLRELSSEVHRLSYQLHPAKLDQLGLVTAARSWCRDVMRQSGIAIEFNAKGMVDEAPADVALCLFRIIQESLRNVVRHSGATLATVALTADPVGVRLVVTDDGRGFDAEAVPRPGGLGLVSIHERVRLLHGTVAVQAGPGAGVTVSAAIPRSGKQVLITSESGAAAVVAWRVPTQ